MRKRDAVSLWCMFVIVLTLIGYVLAWRTGVGVGWAF